MEEKMETKKSVSVSVAPHKPRRHMNVVGGTNLAPSLREVVHHRNAKPPPKKKGLTPRKHSAMIPVVREKRTTSTESRPQKGRPTCDLCSKVQRHWIESDGLRKKTLFSDVTLHASDGDYFYCNSFVLAVWSKPLLDKARCERSRSGQEEWIIYMDVFSGEILHSALRFMYGGAVIDLPPKHLPEIVKMAEEYKMEELRRSCFLASETIPLKVENACAMWCFADEYDLTEAWERAMRFIYANLEKVVADRDWARVSHRPELLMKLFEASVAWTTTNTDWQSWKQDDEAPNSFAKGVRAVWKESNDLRQPHAYSDKVIITKGGRNFHVHTQIIHATAPQFAAFLQAEAEANDVNMVYMDDMDDDTVEEFLRFMYRQEPTSSFPQLASLVTVLAATYQVDDLMRICERAMAAQQVSSADAALEMLKEAEEHRMGTAKSVCFRFIYNNYPIVQQREDWQKLVHDEPQLLTEMMLELKRFRRLKE